MPLPSFRHRHCLEAYQDFIHTYLSKERHVQSVPINPATNQSSCSNSKSPIQNLHKKQDSTTKNLRRLENSRTKSNSPPTSKLAYLSTLAVWTRATKSRYMKNSLLISTCRQTDRDIHREPIHPIEFNNHIGLPTRKALHGRLHQNMDRRETVAVFTTLR